MRADCLSGARGGEGRVGDVEGRLGSAAQQPGPSISSVDNPFDTNDGSDMGLPVGAVEFAFGIEDADGAAFVATAPLVVAVAGTTRGGGVCDPRDCLKQGRLVAFDLNDQGDVGLCGDVEVFF